jgi:4-amino-4-deoxy-L-arabinose transferase-like glycosyltransferase
MTMLLERPRATEPPTSPTRRQRTRDYLRLHRLTLAYLVPLMAIAGVASRLNMGGSPQRIDDEGTYTAQAYAIDKLGQLTHYTYWYDHPPLGWIQIAAWTKLTNGFARFDPAVLAGREAMVFAHLVAVGLLWLLARRLLLSRPAAAGAVLIYALSPLAVQFTRTVYLDNVATPWMIAAFALALSRRKQLPAFAGAAVCFAIAVLSKETFLLLLPFLAWVMWRSAAHSTRRYTLAVAGSLLTLTLGTYLLFALVKGEVLPASQRVSLFDGLKFQLVGRESSGSVLDAASQAGRSIRVWLTLDPVLPVVSTIAALVALSVRRLRPFAAALLFQILVLLKPGYLPVPFVIALLPFAALLTAAMVDHLVRTRGRTLTALSVLAALAAAAVAVPLWTVQLRGLFLADLDRPMRQAQSWVDENVHRDQRVLVDDSVWVDLVRAGFPRDNVVWYYKADTDPAVQAKSPNGWKDYDYVLVTQALQRSIDTDPIVKEAFDNATKRAIFGSGDQEVDVVQVHPEGRDVSDATAKTDTAARTTAGRALVDNPRITLSTDARSQLSDGTVDSRLVTLLASLAGQHRLTVTGFPAVFGENGLGARRQMTVSTVDGTRVDGGVESAIRADVQDVASVYRPEVTRDGSSLRLTFGLTPTTDLLPSPTS